MYDVAELKKHISISEWVNEVKENEPVYKTRQVVEIVLNAIGMDDDLSKSLYLKGGTLLAIAFKSERVTADVDFSCVIEDHEKFSADLKGILDQSMERASVKLGYLDLICKVQTIKKLPKPSTFPDASYPAIKVKVAFALRGSSNEKKILDGRSPDIIELDISFNEQITAFQKLILDDVMVHIKAYSIIDLIAEKYRAIIQQPSRNRTRRQDVYDIAFLLKNNSRADIDEEKLLKAIMIKANSRNLKIHRLILGDEEIKNRSQKEWNTLQEELSEKLPDFEEDYEIVRNFFEALNWRGL